MTRLSAAPSRSAPRTVVVLTTILLLGSAAGAMAHDMFIKPERFRVPANADVLVRLLNGTFSRSENAIARNRLLDVSIVSPAGRVRLDTAAWGVAGDTSRFRIRTERAGIYVLGVSTRPNVIPLEAKDFNEYLRSDGIPDVLAARRKAGELATPARERYHKHVKAILLAGGTPGAGFDTELGYPAELVPVENPYVLRVGQSVRVRTLVDGKPAPNQFVLYGGRTLAGGRIEQRSTRSDANGVATIPLRRAGTWYVKFINMTRLRGDAEADYESKWATLTFDLR